MTDDRCWGRTGDGRQETGVGCRMTDDRCWSSRHSERASGNQKNSGINHVRSEESHVESWELLWKLGVLPDDR
jgi:hypothetical protein